MLSCENLTVSFGDSTSPILKQVKAVFQERAMNAVIGPSGCGKTTMMKAILGIIESKGNVKFGHETIQASENLIGKVGFAPQFTCAHENLTVREAISFVLDLCVSGNEEKQKRLQSILEIIGLKEHDDKLVKSLSGGQLRRLGLGLELTTNPPCMVCDEVTSGLDPRSEDQILELLRNLVEKQGKTFINIIHNLGKLYLFDTVTVVFGGDVIFQGTPSELNYYFGISDPLHLYDTLNQQELSHWQQRWANYSHGMDFKTEKQEVPKTGNLPSAISQISTLLLRRYKLFFRDKAYLWMTIAITIGFPCIVVIFALDGLPQIESISLDQSELSVMDRFQSQVDYRFGAAKTASLVSGLIMFQVVLLTLMGSNNGAREIAAERSLYEKERLNGLRPFSYAISKMLFTCLVAIIQGVVMTLIVKEVCEFPGPLSTQIITLSMCCISMSWVCLGFSSLAANSEKASLLSIYLVGFQLPLSGIVLALPDSLVWVCRPFINAYWSWDSYVSSMINSRLYDTITISDPTLTLISPPWIALMVLGLQAMIGVGFIFWGCQSKMWN